MDPNCNQIGPYSPSASYWEDANYDLVQEKTKTANIRWSVIWCNVGAFLHHNTSGFDTSVNMFWNASDVSFCKLSL